MSVSLKSVGAITIFVEDPSRSKAFYEKVFDAPAVYEDDNSVAFKFENTIVNLLARPAAHELVDAGPVASGDAGASFQLTVWVDDADAVCAELVKRGVELLNGPLEPRVGDADRGVRGSRRPRVGGCAGARRMTDERSQRERMLAGDLYIADDPELARESRRAAELYTAFNASSPHDAEARRRILAELLGSFGEGSEIRPPFYCDYGYQTHIGAGTFLNFGVVALDVARITIGDDVQIGPLVQLLTPTHPVDAELRRAKWEAAEPIAIGDNVWLGGGVIVCPGVTIGEDTVVGAGAVVTRDLPAGVVAAGVPARVIRELQPTSRATPKPE